MGKAIMFMVFTWFIVVIAGNVMQGQIDFVRTTLTAPVSATDNHIHVQSTVGYPDRGIVVIENEHIAYGLKTLTTFEDAVGGVQPLVRGAEGTTATTHASGKAVTTVPGALINSSASYSVAVLSDSSGIMAFISFPVAFLTLLGAFFFLPLSFLGTDLQILTFLWVIIGIGMIAGITIQMNGGRRI